MGDARRSRRVAALVASLLVGSTAGASAQTTPEGVALLGPDLEASQDPTAAPRVVSAAVAAQGAFVVVWRWDVPTLPSQVRGRAFSANQQPLGAEFRIDTSGYEVVGAPTALAQPDGSFLVLWEEGGRWSIGESLRARRLALPATPDFAVPPPTDEWLPSGIAGGADGGFVVVSGGCTVLTTDDPCEGVALGYGFCCLESKVRSQVYDADGAPVGALQDIATTDSTILQGEPIGGPGGELGSFVVVSSDYLERSSLEVTRLGADGVPLGDTVSLAVGQEALLFGTERVAASPGGGFLVAWAQREPEPNPTFASDVRLRRFASDGSAIGAAFEVNELTADDQQLAGLVVGEDGSALVSFLSYGSLDDDTLSGSVQARAFRPDGTVLGGQFQVNAHTPFNQVPRAVAAGSDGRFVVAWTQESYGPGAPRPNVDARALRVSGLFADGFESGDTSRWSPQTR